ncbi:MAG: hypothetical protein KF855_11895 [Acidobacteria bacterium]|nr:hypothetical protein [Acidobacteriota bacterium]
MIYWFISNFKDRGFTFILVFFVTFSMNVPSTDGQEKIKGKFIDEILDINCDRQRSQIDNFILRLGESPDSKGVIVIHGENSDPIIAYRQKMTIMNHLKIRRFNTDRILIFLGKNEPRLRTELWEATESELDGFSLIAREWDFKVRDFKQPILSSAESWTDGIGCSYIFDLEFYSKFLFANKNLIGRVIIRDESIRKFNSVRTKLTKDLLEKYRVSQNQLEFGFIQSKTSDIEYWFIPSDIFGVSK